MIAVILVGGFGTRLRPLTLRTPKAMLPIANRPFIEHQLEHLAGHGVDRVILACGYQPDQLREHLGDRVEYVVEDEPLGTGGAIAHAARGIDETFLALNGDVLTDLDVSALVALHRERGARATLALHPVDDPSRFGVVVTSAGGQVEAFIEKPAPGTAPASTINAGTYVLEPGVLDLVEPGRAVSVEAEVFPRLVGAGLYAMASEGRWLDIGTPQSYLTANLERTPPGGLIDPSATVSQSAHVERSVIGPRVVVGAGARVVNSVLLQGALVSDREVVENVVMNEDGRVW